MNNSYAEFEGLNNVYHNILALMKGYDENLLGTPGGFAVFLEIEKLRSTIWNILQSLIPKHEKGSVNVVVARVSHRCASCRKIVHKNDRFYKAGSSKKGEFCVKCGIKRYGVMHSWNIQRY